MQNLGKWHLRRRIEQRKGLSSPQSFVLSCVHPRTGFWASAFTVQEAARGVLLEIRPTCRKGQASLASRDWGTNARIASTPRLRLAEDIHFTDSNILCWHSTRTI